MLPCHLPSEPSSTTVALQLLRPAVAYYPSSCLPASPASISVGRAQGRADAAKSVERRHYAAKNVERRHVPVRPAPTALACRPDTAAATLCIRVVANLATTQCPRNGGSKISPPVRAAVRRAVGGWVALGGPRSACGVELVSRFGAFLKTPLPCCRFEKSRADLIFLAVWNCILFFSLSIARI